MNILKCIIYKTRIWSRQRSFNIIPLFHGVISQVDFTGAGEAFIGDREIKCSYFEYVGFLIGAKLVEYQNELDIWI